MFRNEPVGCTGTIMYQIYQEKGLDIAPNIAGLLCAAIISDTLMFRSPTCTMLDKAAAEALADIAGISIPEFASEMFRAGSNLKDKSPEEIFYQDFKKFVANDLVFGVGQITSMDRQELVAIKDKLLPYMEKALANHEVEMLFFMLTDILQGTTELLYHGNGARELAVKAFHLPEDTKQIILQDTVSRKKQIIPAMMIAAQE